MLGTCFAVDDVFYDPTYNSGNGAFYANGNAIVIDKDDNGDTVITWSGGSQIVPPTVTVFGGGTNGSVYESSSIVMNDGDVASIVGGGASTEESQPAVVINSSIIVNGGIVSTSISGGGYVYAEIGSSSIIINNGVVSAVVGGGMASATVNGVYYSVGTEEEPQASPNRTENASITINNGTINSPSLGYGLVYGGGQGYSYVGTTNVVINGGDLSNAYVTAGGSNGYTGSSNVIIGGGNIYLYQSTNRGTVEEVITKVTGGTIEKFYVGGETEDPTVTGIINKAEIALLDGNITMLESGKSNSEIIDINDYNYTLIETDDIEITNDNITSGEVEVSYNISFSSTTMTIQANESKKVEMFITTTPIGYERLFNDIIYRSDNEEIATVTKDGVVTGIKEGNTKIYASLLEEQVMCDVTVIDSNGTVVLVIIMVLILLAILLLILFLL